MHQNIINWKKIGVKRIVAVSMDQKSITQTMEIFLRSKEEKWSIEIFPAIGIHPWKAHHIFEDTLLIRSLEKLHVPILGEIGLDHRFIKQERWDNQEKVFVKMINLAEKYSAPIIIHSKDAEKRIMELLTSVRVDVPIILHWYTGPISIARKGMDCGFYFSITPAIEYSKIQQQIVREFPLELLLFESDGPMGYRFDKMKIYGTPSWTPMIAHRFNELRSRESFNEIVSQVEINVKHLLKISN